MPINDPGNAGTASEPNGRETYVAAGRPQLISTGDHEDRRRRAMALALSITSALILLPSVALAGFVDWKWFPVGLAAWFTVMMIASGIVTYRHGPTRKP